ncbi:unnamed protein product [Nezara viridula]|uniref:Uncharacterized protein n=1 Tax=Nezara viridula TaxID=85310 RepID=A0A9P0E6Z6_NEZVI|nr:unnamed protein product [Nezara viridula]
MPPTLAVRFLISGAPIDGIDKCEGDPTACCGYPLNKCKTFGSCSACVSDLLPLNVFFLPGCLFETTVGNVISALAPQSSG